VESVRAYPRPPAIEPSTREVRVVFAGRVVAESRRAQRVLEQGLPPVYYVPREDVSAEHVVASGGPTTHCPWKGDASYFDVVVGDRRAERAAWAYERPIPEFEPIAGAVAFYPGAMDECTLDGEPARRDGGFAGWVTSEIDLG
jgi:uncharacterized protein (DUF427 family)